MGSTTTRLLKAGLSALYYTGAGRLMSPLTGGAGVIFTLHHVRPARRDGAAAFDPNGILAVTPEFLDGVIRQVIEAGYEILSLDEAAVRLKTGGSRPFACFTLDDGYRDNRDHALPIFRRYGVPFTIYVPSAFADGTGELWWLTLERTLAKAAAVEIDMDGEARRFETRTADEKQAVFDAIYWWLRAIPEREARAAVAALAAAHGIDPLDACREEVMSWEELRALSRDPLVTIGAHTTGHFALSKLSREEARTQIADNVARIEAEIGKPCRHFSYPYGCEKSAGEREFALCRELGLATAVTTRKGMIHSRDASRMTGLPRMSLNGEFQDRRYIEVLLSGAPFALWDAMRRVARPVAGA